MPLDTVGRERPLVVLVANKWRMQAAPPAGSGNGGRGLDTSRWRHRDHIIPYPDPDHPCLDPSRPGRWLIGAARDAASEKAESRDSAQDLIPVLQAHALLGVAAEKLQAAAVADTQARRIRTAGAL